MDETVSFVETLDHCITEEMGSSDPDDIYRFLHTFFAGIAENKALPCRVELNEEDMTVAPMFAAGRDGEELLVVYTDMLLAGECFASVKLQALVRLLLDRDACQGILFNPGGERSFYVPNSLIVWAFSAAMEMSNHIEENSGQPDDDDKQWRITRPIGRDMFGILMDEILNLEDDPTDFLILDLEEDEDMLFIQMTRCGKLLHVKLAFDMTDFGWNYPLILGHEMPLNVAIDLLHTLCVEGKSPDDIELIQTEFRNMGFGKEKDDNE